MDENEELVLATINSPARRNAEKRERRSSGLAASAQMSPAYASRSRRVMLQNVSFLQPRLCCPQNLIGAAGCSQLLVESWYWDAPSQAPLMSQDAKTGPAFWRSYYVFCNAICNSLRGPIVVVFAFAAFTAHSRSGTPIRPAGDDLQTSSPKPQVSPIVLSSQVQAGHCVVGDFCAIGGVFDLQYPLAVLDLPFQGLRDIETPRTWSACLPLRE